MTREIPTILGMRRQAEEWLARRGIEQWTPKWREIADQRFARYVHERRTYCVVTDDLPVGHILAAGSLLSADRDFWQDSDDVHSAWYIGGLLTAESARGRSVGTALLDWACEGARRDGRKWLRLDCWGDNYGLHRYYLAHSFEHLRTESVPGRQSGALFQRPTATIEHPLLPHGDDWPQPWDSARAQVLAVLAKKEGGYTLAELQDQLSMDVNAITKALSDLRAGAVVYKAAATGETPRWWVIRT